MPVVPWDGTPLFGGRTLVMSGAMFKGRPKPAKSSSLKPVDEPPAVGEVPSLSSEEPPE